MAVTTNTTPTDAWTKVYSASGDATVSCGSKYKNLEVVNHSSGTNAPADTLQGYKVDMGKIVTVSLVDGDHLWHRIYRDADAGSPDSTKGNPVGIFTVQT